MASGSPALAWAPPPRTRGSLAVPLSHHQKEVWIKGIDTKNHIDGLLITVRGGRKMLKQQLRVGTSSYSWFQLVSVSPRFAQDATYWERFYWEKRPII